MLGYVVCVLLLPASPSPIYLIPTLGPGTLNSETIGVPTIGCIRSCRLLFSYTRTVQCNTCSHATISRPIQKGSPRLEALLKPRVGKVLPRWSDGGGIPVEVGMQRKSQSGEKDVRVLIPYVDCRHWNWGTLLWVRILEYFLVLCEEWGIEPRYHRA